MGLGTNMRMEGAQQKKQAVFPGSLVRRSVLDCFQMINLTVIDLHVLRSAVHLINVVADLKKKEKKGHFTTFYQSPSELHH